jgi:hypothetical protein
MPGMLANTPFNDLSQWVGPRRNVLASMGAGLAGGRNFSEGVAGALRSLPGAQQADAEVQRMEMADAEKQAQIEEQLQLRQQYSQFFADKDPDLAKMVGDGTMGIGEAYGAWKSGKKGADLVKVGAGESLVDPATREAVYTGPNPADDKEQFDRESALNQQYSQSDPLKTYQTVRSGYQKVRDSAMLDTGAGDVSLIFAYMKMLDPTSVVREGEFATAQQTAGIPTQIANLYNQAVQGTRLSAPQRAEFIKSADNIYKSTVSNLTGANDQYSKRAGAWGVDPGNIIVQPQQFDPWQAPASQTDPLGIR